MLRTSALQKCEQLQIIKNLRAENYSYEKIGEVVGLTGNVVKSICRRNGIPTPDKPRKSKQEKAALQVCKQCGKPIDNPWNRKGKTFCSDRCRTKYQNGRKKLQRLAAVSTPKTPEKQPETSPEKTGLPAESELSLEDRGGGAYGN